MRPKILLLSLVFIAALAAIIPFSFSYFGRNKERPAVTTATPEPSQNVNQTPGVERLRSEEKTSKGKPAEQSRPKILSREEWKAKDAVGKVSQHTIQHITIHHTASPQKKETALEKKMQNLQNFSQHESPLASGGKKPAWPHVPYHYYIAVDGQIAEGRDIRCVGDTNTDYNPSGHALVVLEGNFEEEQPSPQQLESLTELVVWLAALYKVPASEIKAHNDYASTLCPGKNLKSSLPALRQKISESVRKSDGNVK